MIGNQIAHREIDSKPEPKKKKMHRIPVSHNWQVKRFTKRKKNENSSQKTNRKVMEICILAVQKRYLNGILCLNFGFLYSNRQRMKDVSNQIKFFWFFFTNIVVSYTTRFESDHKEEFFLERRKKVERKKIAYFITITGRISE